MEESGAHRGRRSVAAARSVTIKDLAQTLGLSITTISRALNGYSDVGEATRARVAEAAQTLGYRPNRNAQRLVTRRTHNLAWVQPENERKFLDPHFVEVMAGVLTGARQSRYDIVMTSHTPDRELATYERYVHDNSVDGFIIDLPRENDPRIDYLIDAGRPFVVHGRDQRHARYGWVDMDNYGNFYRLTRLMIANGHRHLAFINGDEHFNYALYRRRAVFDAIADAGLPSDAVAVYNTLHPMGDAGFRLSQEALRDTRVTAVIYSSVLLVTEGHEVLTAAGERNGRPIAIATIDDRLSYLDLSRMAARVNFVRSSLREAGTALIVELSRQCDHGLPPSGTIIDSEFQILPDMDGSGIAEPLPPHRRHLVG